VVTAQICSFCSCSLPTPAPSTQTQPARTLNIIMQTRSSPSRHMLHRSTFSLSDLWLFPHSNLFFSLTFFFFSSEINSNRLAEQASIPEYKKMSKRLLYDRLKDQFDLDRLQRVEKRRNKKTKRLFSEDKDEETEENPSSSSSTSLPSTSTSSSASTVPNRHKKLRPLRSKSKCDDLDPIMRTPLGKNVFTFIRPNGSFTRFNVDTLVDYMLETGDFTDPSSRLSFSDDDLKTIDGLVS
jgi:hypothetical protein